MSVFEPTREADPSAAIFRARRLVATLATPRLAKVIEKIPRLRPLRPPSAHERVATRTANGLLAVRAMEGRRLLRQGV